MGVRFELKETRDGRFVYNLIAANGEIVLTSQVYRTKRAAEDGVESVKANAVLDERYEEKVGVDGKLFFLLHAANGLVIGRSEMYRSPEAVKKAIASIKQNAPDAETVDIETPVRA